MLVVPATGEAEVGGSLEPREVKAVVSSLDHQQRSSGHNLVCLKKKKEYSHIKII